MKQFARSAFLGFGLAALTAFSAGPGPEKINYKKLERDANGTYRKLVTDNFRQNAMNAFPVIDGRLMDANLSRTVTLDFEDEPQHVSAVVYTMKSGHEKNLKMIEHYSDHDRDGLFSSAERDELEFYYFDGAYKAASDKVHKISINAEFESGIPDIVTYSESAEFLGSDDWSIRKTFQNDPLKALQANETIITDILLDPIKAMKERRKAPLDM